MEITSTKQQLSSVTPKGPVREASFPGFNPFKYTDDDDAQAFDALKSTVAAKIRANASCARLIDMLWLLGWSIPLLYFYIETRNLYCQTDLSNWTLLAAVTKKNINDFQYFCFLYHNKICMNE
eukprot:c20256_g1_i1.p1 GENE.c20256_g1_i1~~c20256_g1_i1.p1  ORF type:complete len:123 (+),score=17.19 c20256_g1_i1:60-428(+)